MRNLLEFPDPNLCDWSTRRQSNVMSSVCRIGDEVWRCKFQFHGTAGCVGAKENAGGGLRNLEQSYEELLRERDGGFGKIEGVSRGLKGREG